MVISYAFLFMKRAIQFLKYIFKIGYCYLVAALFWSFINGCKYAIPHAETQ